ncbi:MAG: FAD:protein FMN transferase [candidate division NC10 bacterium]|nr:FAD:protein FMN transferase [candidate division NC10 bacterium]
MILPRLQPIFPRFLRKVFAPRPIQEIHYVMGTLLDIALFGVEPAMGRTLLRRCFREAKRLEHLLSAHDEESALSRLNRMAGRGPVEVEKDLFALLQVAAGSWEETGGAFDITSGPLIDLWEKAALDDQEPDGDCLTAALGKVGPKNLRLLDGTAELLLKGIRLDLGGIGKGHAVERIVGLLKEAGVQHALVNFGESSLFALGSPPREEAWRIAIKGMNEGEWIGSVAFSDRTLSVSGSYGRSLEIQGRRYGHILDPRTGRPLERELLSVVLGPSATEAEAFSTALLILDREEGLALLERHPQLEGMIVNEGRIAMTPRFTRETRFEPFDSEMGRTS